jgi:hypothetical protein
MDSTYVETDLGPVCSRCTSAAPPRLVCTSCGRAFASVTEATRAVALYAMAVYDARRGLRHGPGIAAG